ncbi:MAG TPA: alpha/beta hydrolase-fold protein [Bryobacteraceae bacterium]|nr:alpha/beta hydrolase-fold protein [Bryobacteraceae bacterium]
MKAAAALLLAALPLVAQHRDETYPSRVFAGPRNYRIFLPKDYAGSAKRYGTIYYFHGHSDRYTLEHYDKGQDTVPKIEAYVASHDVIVVAPDGFDARHYTGFYGGTPYDVRREGGDLDYAEAFLELVAHIDANYRTRAARPFRGISGLSMGGFMSLWISARYPGLVGSASAFNPGPEFYLGEKGRRSLWRPKDHVLLHESMPVRLIRASGDYISQYHEETRAAYARTPTVDFEYRQDEYHRHWATSIAETFDFHLRAFQSAAAQPPAGPWTYTSPFRRFSVHDYGIESKGLDMPALVSLEDVTKSRFRLRTRQWAPDGPPAACAAIQITTAPLYTPGKSYAVSLFSLENGERSRRTWQAAEDGRLSLELPCDGRQVEIEGIQSATPVVVPPQRVPRLVAGEEQTLSVQILNPAGTANLVAELSSEYPTIKIAAGKLPVQEQSASVLRFPIVCNASSTEWAHARLFLKIGGVSVPLDVEIAPDGLGPPLAMRVLDGRTETFSVFRQKGNQGGGGPVSRRVTEGSGNGDGILQPGETATIWLQYRAGIDGLDRGNWCRAKVYAVGSPWLAEVEDIQEQKQLEWTSAMNRTSVVALRRDTPRNTVVPLILDCESWTYYFTPDVRYGREPLYQAFQFHRHHLFRSQWSANTDIP